jgi:hypothetical protein
VAFMPMIITLSNLLAHITCDFLLLQAPGLAANLATSEGFSLLMRPKSSQELRYVLKTLLFPHSSPLQIILSCSFISRSVTNMDLALPKMR